MIPGKAPPVPRLPWRLDPGHISLHRAPRSCWLPDLASIRENEVSCGKNRLPRLVSMLPDELAGSRVPSKSVLEEDLATKHLPRPDDARLHGGGVAPGTHGARGEKVREAAPEDQDWPPGRAPIATGRLAGMRIHCCDRQLLGGRMTVSMTWITPFEASTSAATTVASLMRTLSP